MSLLGVRRTAAVVALFSALLLGACNDTGPAPAVPLTPAPGHGTPLPEIFLLRADQMPGYARSNSLVLTPDIVASNANDPTLAKTLTSEGYLSGAQWTYSPPNPSSSALAFYQVITQAAIFGDAAGAARNADFENTARNQRPSGGGTIARVTDLAPRGVDSLTVFVAESSAGTNAAQSYLAIMRRGRVVAELLAVGDPTTATEQNFSALVLLAESRLASAPA